MRRGVEIIFASLVLVGCDGLVGGECEAGHANREGTCVRDEGPAGGGGFDGIGGEGGIDGIGGEGGIDGGAGGAGGGTDALPWTAGHVVALGFDPTQSSTGRTMLTNATLLSLHEPVRVLSLSTPRAAAFAAPLEQAVVEGVVSRGRSAQISSAHVADPPDSTLRQASDVILVSGRAVGPTSTFAPGWSDALGAFIEDGGVIVVVSDRGSGRAVARFLAGTHLIPGVEANPAPSGDLAIGLWTDAIAVGATSPFDSGGPAFSFTLPEGELAASVAVAADGVPVAIHWAVVHE